nr:MAG TPA: hypothetical protein [Caudoviricetes sp.]
MREKGEKMVFSPHLPRHNRFFLLIISRISASILLCEASNLTPQKNFLIPQNFFKISVYKF